MLKLERYRKFQDDKKSEWKTHHQYPKQTNALSIINTVIVPKNYEPNQVGWTKWGKIYIDAGNDNATLIQDLGFEEWARQLRDLPGNFS